jgi:hypothetical protein
VLKMPGRRHFLLFPGGHQLLVGIPHSTSAMCAAVRQYAGLVAHQLWRGGSVGVAIYDHFEFLSAGASMVAANFLWLGDK